MWIRRRMNFTVAILQFFTSSRSGPYPLLLSSLSEKKSIFRTFTDVRSRTVMTSEKDFLSCCSRWRSRFCVELVEIECALQFICNENIPQKSESELEYSSSKQFTRLGRWKVRLSRFVIVMRSRASNGSEMEVEVVWERVQHAQTSPVNVDS